MGLFGDKKDFALEYNFYNKFASINSSLDIIVEFDLYVQNKSVCEFIREGTGVYKFIWDIRDLVEWLEENLGCILTEEGFPLETTAKTGIDFANIKCPFDPFDEEDEFNFWQDEKDRWLFSHGWFSTRGGGFLADVYFRKVNEKIEISWDSLKNFDEYEIEFSNPKGLYYVNAKVFENVVTEFINKFKIELKERFGMGYIVVNTSAKRIYKHDCS